MNKFIHLSLLLPVMVQEPSKFLICALIDSNKNQTGECRRLFFPEYTRNSIGIEGHFTPGYSSKQNSGLPRGKAFVATCLETNVCSSISKLQLQLLARKPLPQNWPSV